MLNRNYQKASFLEGSKLFIAKSATKAQALVRQWLVRGKLYDKLIADGYQSTTESLKTKLLAHRLARVVAKMSTYMNKKHRLIQDTLAQADQMKAKHETLMAAYEQNYEALVAKRLQRNAREVARQPPVPIGSPQPLQPLTEAATNAQKRLGEPCSICLCELRPDKPLLATSCGHLFHALCLVNFESFSATPNKKCPNCRQPDYSHGPFVASTH